MADVPFAALDANYLDANRVFSACSDTGEFLERRDVAIASCGLPVDPLNLGLLKPPYETPEATAHEVARYFQSRELPFRLTFRAGAPGDRLLPLERAGWTQAAEPIPGMMRELPASIPAAPDELRIEPVQTPEQLVAFREIAFAAFGYPVQAAHIFLNERVVACPGVELLSGLVDDRVVATSLLLVTHDVAGIYYVTTAEEQRGRGYGAALTWAVIEAGRERGCRLASLQASVLGKPVYERMGFEHVLDYATLKPPER